MMNLSGDIHEFSRQVILDGIEKAGSIAKLAKAIEVKYETVRSWVKPASPRLDHIDKVMNYLQEKE